MDYVLGTGPGFTDRLSAHLRDRKGLAYTVNANITCSASDQPGLFTCYIGTYPDKFAVVKDLIHGRAEARFATSRRRTRRLRTRRVT